MKKVKPNLRKMFNFHTIILVVVVIVVTKLHTHTSEGKLQRLHKHHHNHNNYKHHNAVDIAEANDDADKQQESYGHHNNPQQQQQQQQQQHEHHHQHSHFHSHSHSQNHNHHHQRHYDGTTPSLEFTTSSSSSPSSLSSYSSSSVAISSDNEFLIKQHEEQPLTNNNNNKNDEIHYKTKDLQSSAGTTHHTATRVTSATTSTTSNPSLSIHVTKENVHYLKASSLNSTSTHAETLPNSIREHTHHSHSNRLISTPLTTPEGNSGIDNNHATDNFATMYSAATGLEYKNSNWKLASNKAKDTQINEPSIAQEKQNQNRNHNEANNEQQRPPPSQQNYEDYYADAEDDDVDDDGEDDYGEDEGDNDGISYDDDNNLSDRSYARITRSKLDDDYIDDEPYRSGINELSMQRDAAPGVLTEQKYMDVGNEKAVQQARERYIQDQKRPRTPHELATEHWHRMIQATKCRKPLPRVIPVSNNTSKRYEPYATILHRCGDDTGCCGSTASVCTVKRHEIVMVYVFSYDFNYRKEIEALPMQNHTECHCVNRGSLLHDSMPRDKRSGGSISYLHHFQRQQRKLQQQQQQYRELETPAYSQQQFHHQQQLQHTLDCHCPRHFNVFEEDVERHVHLPKPHTVFIRKCRCDCLLNNQTCLRFKHGEEGFSLEDRKCILEHDCKPPVCLYGDYNLRVGRCPGYRSHQLQTT